MSIRNGLMLFQHSPQGVERLVPNWKSSSRSGRCSSSRRLDGKLGQENVQVC